MKGFTLIELTVTILMVAILAAVALPVYRGKIDAAKWSEGKTTIGTIGTALRTYVVAEGSSSKAVPSLIDLAFAPGDLDGSYFTGGESGVGDYAWVINNHNPIDFLITATAPPEIHSPSQITLDERGEWTIIP